MDTHNELDELRLVTTADRTHWVRPTASCPYRLDSKSRCDKFLEGDMPARAPWNQSSGMEQKVKVLRGLGLCVVSVGWRVSRGSDGGSD
jgi:hypothetical protein